MSCGPLKTKLSKAQLLENLLGRRIGLLLVVAFLAAGNAVAARGFTSARNGNDMIQSKVLRTDDAVTVMALALRDQRLPPVRLPQLARLLAFTLHMRGVGIEIEPLVHGMKNEK